jgi:hypothetical protein
MSHFSAKKLPYPATHNLHTGIAGRSTLQYNISIRFLNSFAVEALILDSLSLSTDNTFSTGSGWFIILD